jgi:hypothetical protein
MSRPVLVTLLIAAVFALGCGGGDTASQAGRPSTSGMTSARPDQDAAAEPLAAQTHRPIIVGEESEAAGPSAEAASPFPADLGTTARPEFSFAPAPEQRLAAAAPTDRELNPLRRDFAPSGARDDLVPTKANGDATPPVSAEVGRANPLRQSRSAPRRAAPPEPAPPDPAPPEPEQSAARPARACFPPPRRPARRTRCRLLRWPWIWAVSGANRYQPPQLRPRTAPTKS